VEKRKGNVYYFWLFLLLVRSLHFVSITVYENLLLPELGNKTQIERRFMKYMEKWPVYLLRFNIANTFVYELSHSYFFPRHVI